MSIKKTTKNSNKTIAYRFETPAYPGKILYVNIIPGYSCINDCLFCSRPRNESEVGKPNIYETKAGVSLFLSRSPTMDEIMESIAAKIKPDDKEVAIIGLGEPLLYLPKVVEVIRKVKLRYAVKTRIDTNGLVKCLYNNAAIQLADAGLDEIRISVNAVNESEYNALCRPKVRNAFQNLTKFVQECISAGIDTYSSFVMGFAHEGIVMRNSEEYAQFAASLGIKRENVILRQYVRPLIE